jgi:acyl-CoA dehydrogenase
VTLLEAALTSCAPTEPLDAALRAAEPSSSVGAAFWLGYGAALRRLVPTLPSNAVAALCATEVGGNHPRAMACRLSPEGILDGEKTWVTGGTQASVLLVVATTGQDSAGRPVLRLVQVSSDARGVDVAPLGPTPFVPEIPHASVRLTQVQVDAAQILPGDGYSDYVKPFRTVEDIHVHSCVLAYVLGIAQTFAWPRPAQEELLSLVLGARGLAGMKPSAPGTHIALGGWLSAARAALLGSRPFWDQVDRPVREAWQRDQPLLDVAQKAREKRLLVAWDALSARQEAD